MKSARLSMEFRIMNVQVIARDGEPEYAVLPWAEYQALLQAAGMSPASAPAPVEAAPTAALAQIKTLREGLGLSIDQLARTVGISPHYLTMIEEAQRQPDTAIQRALARALGVSGWSVDS